MEIDNSINSDSLVTEIPVINKHSKDEYKLVRITNVGMINSSYAIIPSDQAESIKPGDSIVINCGNTYIEATKVVSECNCKSRYYESLSYDSLPVYMRHCLEEDLAKMNELAIEKEVAKNSFKDKVIKYKLEMRLVDVHFQFDRHRLFFFYTAENRVDFRELAKDLASQFKTRIELRQISYREEARYKGGIGTCGREFCCSSHLTNFKRISTQFAVDQHIAVNVSKLSGPCTKLKCCLSYELDESNKENVVVVDNQTASITVGE